MTLQFPHCDINDLDSLLWVHVALLSLCAVLVVSSLLSQFKDPAPYGRHFTKEKAAGWGFPIPQRLGHIVSDAIPGIPYFLAVYLLYAGLLPKGGAFSKVNWVNVFLTLGWLLHYFYRGLIHPLIMKYSSPTVPVGITIAGLFPNCLFGYLIAAQLACTEYPENWENRPRFIIGTILYLVGTIINRWADLRLRSLRIARDKVGSTGSSTPILVDKAHSGDQQGSSGAGSKYFIPTGGLYNYISCPNYFGEMIEWLGYALACWSYPTLGWALFGISTFVPRALTHHAWYKKHFGAEYPARRKALIPFVL